MPERSYRPLLLVLTLLGLGADQVTKYTVFHWLAGKPEDEQTRAHTWVLFRTSPDKNDLGGFSLVAEQNHVNSGALFGTTLFLPPEISNRFFAVVSLLAAIGILLWSLQRSTARDPLLCCALGLILAGTLGNFYDRVVFDGVRDFLHWNYLYNWPVFNVADCCLVCGAALMLLQAFVLRPPTAVPKANPGASAPPGAQATVAPVQGRSGFPA